MRSVRSLPRPWRTRVRSASRRLRTPFHKRGFEDLRVVGPLSPRRGVPVRGSLITLKASLTGKVAYYGALVEGIYAPVREARKSLRATRRSSNPLSQKGVRSLRLASELSPSPLRGGGQFLALNLSPPVGGRAN